MFLYMFSPFRLGLQAGKGVFFFRLGILDNGHIDLSFQLGYNLECKAYFTFHASRTLYKIYRMKNVSHRPESV